nr:MAG TPA: hypothetical protein [Caudoviricetes sp.]DAS16976.1 MAG TPA: hypothetical protein [Caudoviricetes sp.]
MFDISLSSFIKLFSHLKPYLLIVNIKRISYYELIMLLIIYTLLNSSALKKTLFCVF